MSDVIEVLRDLVAFPTVSTNPVMEIAAYLAQRCVDIGFQIERFDDPQHDGKTNIVATIGPEAGDGGLVITGHMDVVPVEGQPWTSDPFVLCERNGRLQGRGTADMKGFIAATMIALRHFSKEDFIRPLVLVWTHDEEVGCHGSAHLAKSLLAAGRSLPRDCLVGEPTDYQVLRMHAGHVAVRVRATGAAAHSAYPELGANAIEAAAAAITALRGLASELAAERWPQPGLERDWVPMNIGLIEGGAAVNIVPDSCVFDLGFRPLPGRGHEEVLGRIKTALQTLQLPAGTHLAHELMRVTPSLLSPPTTPLAQVLVAEAANAQLGAAGFATDGGNLARCGCEPLVFGPGSIKVAHQADEHIDAVDLLRAVPMLERVIRARCC